jgi:hypothetical protein
MDAPVSLERLVLLRVPVAWHEAVAIAQQVGRVAKESDTAVGMDNVVLTATGDVELSGPTDLPFAGAAAAGALDMLLDRSQAPRELVALVDRAKAPGSTLDVASELEFFARPDRAAVVASVAERALTHMSDARQQAELDRLRADVATASQNNPPPPSTPRRVPAWAVGGAAVVAGAGVVFALGMMGDAAPAAVLSVNASASAPAEKASPIETITSGLDALVDKGMAALGLSSAPAAEPSEPAKPAPTRAAPRLARRSGPSTEAAPLVLLVPPMEPAAPTRYTAEVIEETDFIVPTDMVHEAGAANLRPPVLRWPQLPQEPESQPIEEGVSYLEILINEGGTVDKVRLRATRINFHERMLVSAAKAWVFHPARIDGRAVKYLMRVPILAQ